MSIKYYLTPLLRYWWLLLAAAGVATIASFIVTLQQPPIYQTRATLVIGRSVYEANPNSNDLFLSQQLSSYYAEIGQRQEIRDATMQALGLTRLPQYIVQPFPNSQLLEIVVTDSNPLRAQAVANELSNQLINQSPMSPEMADQNRQQFINDQIAYLEEKIRETLDEIDQAELQLMELTSARQIADSENQITALQTKLSQLQQNYASLISNSQEGAINTLTLVERAALPASPIGPNKLLTIGLSALIATLIAAGAAYLLEFLDDTFKSADDVTHVLGLPVIGQISEIQNGKQNGAVQGSTPRPRSIRQIQSLLLNRRRMIEPVDGSEEEVYVASNPRSLVAEAFRTLRINLDFVGINQPVRTILVTSPEPSEGKTSVASNLAVVMAQGGRRVILIDADLRRPMVHQFFKFSNQAGISDVLMERLHLHEAIRPWEEQNVSVITSGEMPANPVDLLSSSRFNGVLDELKQWTDMVIIDGPPMMLPEAAALATKVDGVLMVVRHGFSRKEFAKNGLEQLRRVGARIFGVVLNRIPRSGAHYYGSAYYGYYEAPEKASPAGAGK